jgi:ABC-type cobalamin/Fe3+-siderophores transport system ATPase subunit
VSCHLQFDALFDLLTGREHLELYARIKVSAIQTWLVGRVAHLSYIHLWACRHGALRVCVAVYTSVLISVRACFLPQGIPESHVQAVVDAKIEQMDLKEYADRNASTYSGGNKRKLR